MGYMVKAVRLLNIKSHVDTTVEFSKGINLVEGDVGSGKTTILQSIEAALFGYEIKSMLRVGESVGEIAVEFEPELRVGWKIKRQDSSSGYVVEGGKRYNLAASEIRGFFVKRFGLADSPSIRSEPVFFRLAVYVRQEELKSILRGGDHVEELVRRATGVKLYSTARENAAAVVRPLLEGLAKRLDEKIKLLENRLGGSAGLEQELEEVNARLAQLGVELEEAEAQQGVAQAELDELRERSKKLEVERAAVQGELGGLEASIRDIKRRLGELKEEIDRDTEAMFGLGGPGRLEGLDRKSAEQRVAELEAKLLKLEKDRFAFEHILKEIREREDELEEVEGRLRSLREQLGEELRYEELAAEAKKVEDELGGLREEAARLNERLSQYGQIAETGVCPLCGSKIAKEDAGKHLGELRERLGLIQQKIALGEKRRGELLLLIDRAKDQLGLKKQVEELQNRARSLEEKIERLRGQLVYEDYEQQIAATSVELEELKGVLRLFEVYERLERAQKEYGEQSDRLGELEERAQKLRERRSRLEAELGELRPALEAKQQRLQQIAERAKRLLGEKAGLEQKAKLLGEQLEQRKRDQAELEDAKAKRALAGSLFSYFSKTFVSVLEQVEQETLRWARRELSARTKEYFALLIQDDDRTVVLDDQYSPMLQRRIGGEWVDIASPSGGERSAMALAFRLALSEVARSRQGIQADFIMLDEPTDGFSEEQLAKFQSLLERLEIPQIILVTHHRSLESLGSNIILVEYTDNGSVVRRVV